MPDVSQPVVTTTKSQSLMIQAQVGCSYAVCSYCPIVSADKVEPFNIRDFRSSIRREAERFTFSEITSVFLSEGNTMSLDMREIVAILRALFGSFSHLQGISVYGNAYHVLRLRPKELRALRRDGLTRIHMGLESGSGEVLRLLNKGVDGVGQIEAAERIKDAGIELNIYVLISAGGRGLSAEHARATTEAINRIAPACVDIQTLVPVPRTPLHDALERGRFELLSPHESIREIRSLLEGIEVPTAVNSNHISNYCNVEGRLPEDRERLLRELRYCFDLDEQRYAVTDIVNVG